MFPRLTKDSVVLFLILYHATSIHGMEVRCLQNFKKICLIQYGFFTSSNFISIFPYGLNCVGNLLERECNVCSLNTNKTVKLGHNKIACIAKVFSPLPKQILKIFFVKFVHPKYVLHQSCYSYNCQSWGKNIGIANWLHIITNSPYKYKALQIYMLQSKSLSTCNQQFCLNQDLLYIHVLEMCR